MPRNIIGSNIIETLRSSDYKTSVHAFAEIIDNSIDANANKIEIITLTRNGSITEINFIDNGRGMNNELLQNCVIFSHSGNVGGDGKTGIFGMGLPNSSLSQCKHFTVVSKNDAGIWMENDVNFEQMIHNNSLEIGDIRNADMNEIDSIIAKSRIPDIKTIIRWRKLDRLDAKRPITFFNRAQKLIGRIHRFKIREGLNIRFLNYSDENNLADIDEVFLENDPLYLTEGPSQVASLINELASTVTSPDPTLSLNTYFSRYTINGTENTVLPLFYKPEAAQQDICLDWHGQRYVIRLVCSIAHSSIQKPGTREGGATKFGKVLAKKVKDAPEYPSGNISWVRNNREIVSGNYNLFNITQENMRFWSIELKWDASENHDNEIDKLLKLTLTKQNISFAAETDFPDDISDVASESDKRQELLCRITQGLNQAINHATNLLKMQAREWDRFYREYTNPNQGDDGEVLPGPHIVTDNILLEALGRGAQLTETEINDLVSRLQNHLRTIERQNILNAVVRYSEIGIQNIIIYCEFADDRNLFETDNFQGRNLTYINIKHPFYVKVISRLKEVNNNDVLVSIELLISSLSRTSENYNLSQEKREDIQDYCFNVSLDLRTLLRNRQLAEINTDDDAEENFE